MDPPATADPELSVADVLEFLPENHRKAHAHLDPRARADARLRGILHGHLGQTAKPPKAPVDPMRELWKVFNGMGLLKEPPPEGRPVPPIKFRVLGAKSEPDPYVIFNRTHAKIVHRAFSEIGQTRAALILGETGVGKTAIVHALCRHLRRNITGVMCSSLDPSLMAAELFGHEKGAFTGAGKTREGLCRTSDGGCLFLDEVGELSWEAQTVLLEALEAGIRPVGANSTVPIDNIVIAATNKNLDREVREGRFRKDLFYRLARHVVRIPPLRERRDEMLAIVRAQIDVFPGLDLSMEAMDWFKKVDHPWPGNVREIRIALSQAHQHAKEEGTERIDAKHLQTWLDEARRAADAGAMIVTMHEARSAAVPRAKGHRGKHLSEQEVRDALDRAAGNKTEAAKLLGISREWLYKLKDLYGIKSEGRKKAS